MFSLHVSLLWLDSAGNANGHRHGEDTREKHGLRILRYRRNRAYRRGRRRRYASRFRSLYENSLDVTAQEPRYP